MVKTPDRPRCPHCGTVQSYDEATVVKRTVGLVATFTACRRCDRTIVWSVRVLGGGRSGRPEWVKP